MFHTFYQNNDPLTAQGLLPKHGSRYLVHNPPQPNLTAEELDKIYALDFARDVHPFYRKQGKVRAMETIKFSITSHRGCYGECNFCSIGLHEGKTVISRSEKSIINEVRKLVALPDFKGYIHDVGGSTANMYGFECQKKQTNGACKNNPPTNSDFYAASFNLFRSYVFYSNRSVQRKENNCRKNDE